MFSRAVHGSLANMLLGTNYEKRKSRASSGIHRQVIESLVMRHNEHMDKNTIVITTRYMGSDPTVRVYKNGERFTYDGHLPAKLKSV